MQFLPHASLNTERGLEYRDGSNESIMIDSSFQTLFPFSVDLRYILTISVQFIILVVRVTVEDISVEINERVKIPQLAFFLKAIPTIMRPCFAF